MLATIYNVDFPGLNLHFKINPVAFSIGGLKVYWYGIILCVGFLIAFFYCLSNCKRFSLDKSDMVDAILVGLICGLIGARLYYVIFYPGSLYREDPIRIFYINEGGIAIYGGLIGGIAGGIIVAKVKKLNVTAALDLAALSFLIGQSIGRWGNFVNQEAFGAETDIFCRMISEKTGGLGVHPCFLYESIWCILGFVLLHFFSIKYRKYNGQIFLMYLVWYGFERMIVEGLRTDSLYIPYLGIRVSQLVAFCTAVVAGFLLVKFRNKSTLS